MTSIRQDLSLVITVNDAGEFHGCMLIDGVASITGPWSTRDALLHHVGRVASERAEIANSQDHADPRAWVV